jgi:hypothetical protein
MADGRDPVGMRMTVTQKRLREPTGEALRRVQPSLPSDESVATILDLNAPGEGDGWSILNLYPSPGWTALWPLGGDCRGARS